VNRGVRGIEEFFRIRYDREAIFLPSGRMALYIAFREWLSPGDRVMISSVTCDVVFFAALAAGLVPVIGPVDPRTGNLDPEAVEESVWPDVRALLTTNLYGTPDRMDKLQGISQKYGVMLIEDACQAFDTRYGGRRIGTFSEAAVFSIPKHVQGIGGVLSFPEARRRTSLLARAEAELRKPTYLRNLASAVAVKTGGIDFIRRIRRLRVPPMKVREKHRIPYVTEEVTRARTGGAGLERFDRWLVAGNKGYRATPGPVHVSETLRKLESYEGTRLRRIEGARKLLGLGLTPGSLPVSGECALYRVPLFVKDREGVLRRFADRGMVLDSIYDPPLERYASAELAERIPSPGAADRWSRDVLPVDPMTADRFLEILGDLPPLVPALEKDIAVNG
jgi:hypothetical protein